MHLKSSDGHGCALEAVIVSTEAAVYDPERRENVSRLKEPKQKSETPLERINGLKLSIFQCF